MGIFFNNSQHNDRYRLHEIISLVFEQKYKHGKRPTKRWGICRTNMHQMTFIPHSSLIPKKMVKWCMRQTCRIFSPSVTFRTLRGRSTTIFFKIISSKTEQKTMTRTKEWIWMKFMNPKSDCSEIWLISAFIHCWASNRRASRHLACNMLR